MPAPYAPTAISRATSHAFSFSIPADSMKTGVRRAMMTIASVIAVHSAIRMPIEICANFDVPFLQQPLIDLMLMSRAMMTQVAVPKNRPIVSLSASPAVLGKKKKIMLNSIDSMNGLAT